MVNFAVDESLFINYNNMQYWVLGIISVVTLAILLEISPRRDTNVIKEIIKTHIKSGNVVITDNWTVYHWLSNPGSGYFIIKFIHLGWTILVLVPIISII